MRCAARTACLSFCTSSCFGTGSPSVAKILLVSSLSLASSTETPKQKVFGLRGLAQQGDPLPAHGGRLQRIVRRQIISARNDLIRNNIYWKAYEGARMLLIAVSHSRRGNPDSPTTASAARNIECRPAQHAAHFRGRRFRPRAARGEGLPGQL